MYRPGSSAGILNTIQVTGPANPTTNILGSNVPTTKFTNMSRQYGVGGNLGTTTIEYDDHTQSSALGFFPAGAAGGSIYIPGNEDLESALLKNGGRVRSMNPRSQFSQRMHKTIDENMIFNKIMSARKLYPQNAGKEEEETLDHRMRIFEDEIIKRIKIIQNFVKTMDGKINRLKASQNRAVTQESVKKSTSRLGGLSLNDDTEDKRPERLRDILEDQAPHGANHHQIKEAVKWELEIYERKTEERFKEIEALIKKIGVKIDK